MKKEKRKEDEPMFTNRSPSEFFFEKCEQVEYEKREKFILSSVVER